MSATESLNGRKKMARRKVENGIFFPARLDFPFPHYLQNRRYFYAFYRRSKRKARDMGVGERHPYPRPCLALHYRFVLRSTYSAGGLRFLSHVTWKIVGKLRRYFTSFSRVSILCTQHASTKERDCSREARSFKVP